MMANDKHVTQCIMTADELRSTYGTVWYVDEWNKQVVEKLQEPRQHLGDAFLEEPSRCGGTRILVCRF